MDAAIPHHRCFTNSLNAPLPLLLGASQPSDFMPSSMSALLFSPTALTTPTCRARGVRDREWCQAQGEAGSGAWRKWGSGTYARRSAPTRSNLSPRNKTEHHHDVCGFRAVCAHGRASPPTHPSPSVAPTSRPSPPPLPLANPPPLILLPALSSPPRYPPHQECVKRLSERRDSFCVVQR